MQSRVQTQNILIPSGTAAGRRDFRVTLDSEFHTCTGYYVIENRTGGLNTQWTIGIKDDQRNVRDLTNGQSLQVKTEVPIDLRYSRKALFMAKGKIIIVTIETFETCTSDLSIDILYELSKDEAQCK